jgi:hypothetical protein
MKNLFSGVCDLCTRNDADRRIKGFRPERGGKVVDDLAAVLIRGTNAYGDRDERLLHVCGDCRRTIIRNLYRVHPKHRSRKES